MSITELIVMSYVVSVVIHWIGNDPYFLATLLMGQTELIEITRGESSSVLRKKDFEG